MNRTILCLMLAAAAAQAAPAKKAKDPVVVITTSAGVFKVQLDAAHAPLSTANFLQYVKEKHYDGTVFHRVIKGFMVQGGGFDGKLHQIGAGHPAIKNEAGNGLKNGPGTLAMARTNVVDSGTDQFFINTANNTFLDHRGESPNDFGYAVFGKVIAGMDVVRVIENVPTQNKPSADGLGLGDVPVKDVIIKTARLAK
ncbi:MAG TPA: peptidylprolyl isomerase [Myxococcales bacterium]|jgi:cyclophilin family peptidyl-prolyl cis-trans isomerase|nr:peptidylprolyl isomerase [Myxococcales bacterium]